MNGIFFFLNLKTTFWNILCNSQSCIFLCDQQKSVRANVIKDLKLLVCEETKRELRKKQLNKGHTLLPLLQRRPRSVFRLADRFCNKDTKLKITTVEK